MRPLDFLPSIKYKLGAIIVAAVGVSTFVIALGVKLRLWPYLTVGLAGVLALVMVQLLARGMTSPLREMALAARAMSQGDYERRVTATSRDEVGELALAFNAMTAELAEVDRVRRDLVANVSHELRTPLTALRAVLENLVDGVQDPDPETFRTMLTQTERLGRLVAQLLDLSRLESRVAIVDAREFVIGDLLAQAVREASLHSPAVSVLCECEANLKAWGDPDLLHQVLMNLVTNAIRHSPIQGQVLLSARRTEAGISFSVADAGPGIAPAELDRVFERFYRADTARTSQTGGTGLGLAIARSIVDLHHGQIRAENMAPGCRVTFEIPLPASLAGGSMTSGHDPHARRPANSLLGHRNASSKVVNARAGLRQGEEDRQT